MAHYAQIENGIVTQVVVMNNDEPEPVAWLEKNIGGEWAQTSYNTRGGVHYGKDGKPDGKEQIGYNYAGIGDTYDKTNNAFYAPQPDPSWVLNKNSYRWEPPSS